MSDGVHLARRREGTPTAAAQPALLDDRHERARAPSAHAVAWQRPVARDVMLEADGRSVVHTREQTW
jgi:hypothetical protein